MIRRGQAPPAADTDGLGWAAGTEDCPPLLFAVAARPSVPRSVSAAVGMGGRQKRRLIRARERPAWIFGHKYKREGCLKI